MMTTDDLLIASLIRYEQAAQFAAGSPKQELRTLATIQAFQLVTAPEGQQPPLLVYFGCLLRRKGALKADEANELARGVAAQGQLALLSKWISEGKILPTKGVADAVRERDPRGAIGFYRIAKPDGAAQRAGLAERLEQRLQSGLGSLGALPVLGLGTAAAEGSAEDAEAAAAAAAAAVALAKEVEEMVVQCYAEAGDLEEVIAACNAFEPPRRPNWLALLGAILSAPVHSPEARVCKALKLESTLRAMPPPESEPDPEDELAVMAYKMNLVHQPPPCPSYAETVRLFLEHGYLAEATKLALDAVGSLEGSEALDASLQTRIVDEHLSRHAPNGAVALIATDCH